jgi:ADP-ribose pyrophosphatase
MNNQLIASGNWLKLVRIGYTDAKGRFRTWESCQRLLVSHSADCNVVGILGMFPNRDTLLVKQFRPAIGKVCIELPAGLVDEGEVDSMQAAKRELKEETGFKAQNIRAISPVLYSDPGMGNTTMRYFLAELPEGEENELQKNVLNPYAELNSHEFLTLNVSQPAQFNPIQNLPYAEEEEIEVVRLPLAEMHSFLWAAEQKGFAVDARLFSIALGIRLAGSSKA